MGGAGVAVAARSPATARRPTPPPPPASLDRHPFCAPQRYCLGTAAQRIGLRLGYDLLATAPGVAGQRRLAAHPLRTAQLVWPTRGTGLEPGQPGQRQRAGET